MEVGTVAYRDVGPESRLVEWLQELFRRKDDGVVTRPYRQDQNRVVSDLISPSGRNLVSGRSSLTIDGAG